MEIFRFAEQRNVKITDLLVLVFYADRIATSLNLKILPAIFTVTQGTQATQESSSLEIACPGWRLSWVWYLAEAPVLSAVACNSVPALTLLSGSTPPEKKPFEPLRRREVYISLHSTFSGHHLCASLHLSSRSIISER